MNMTQQQLHKACEDNKFILLRDSATGIALGHNCAMTKLARFDKYKNSKKSTKWSGFHPCGFQEYISKKLTFLGTTIKLRTV